MSESKNIEHQGIIEQADGQRAKVRILSESACAACHAKGVCTAADLKEKLIDASCEGLYSPGDRVILVGESRLGLQAAWWAYILPLFLLLTTLITTYTLTNNDSLAGLLALAVLVPYFLIIKLLNHKFFKTFSFTIKPSTE